jgi:hypothetical protein
MSNLESTKTHYKMQLEICVQNQVGYERLIGKNVILIGSLI